MRADSRKSAASDREERIPTASRREQVKLPCQRFAPASDGEHFERLGLQRARETSVETGSDEEESGTYIRRWCVS